MTPFGQTICLCMIVKDEAPVIARCLASVLPLIDHWVVVDTGSSDGTQDVVRQALAGVPGELVERPWRDFAHNRCEALELARSRADYSLIIDADDELIAPPHTHAVELCDDSYMLDIHFGGVTYRRTQLVKNTQPWRYVGVLHEFLACDGAGTAGHLPWIIRPNYDGRRRRDPDTFRKDAAVLEAALAHETDAFLAARYTFYLAQSWRDCGEREKALHHYLARAELGFWDQEVFVCLLQAARLKASLGRDPDEVLATYARATAACPARAEAAHDAARLCRTLGRNAEGYAFARPARDLVAPPDGLFVEGWVYDYGLKDELAINAYWAGRHAESLDACLWLLERADLPEGHRARVAANARFATTKLREAALCGLQGALLWPAGVMSPQGELPCPAVVRPAVAPGRVSIITPTRAREGFLPAALLNVRSQDHPDLEWLVLDDSPEPSAFMQDLHDPDVTYLHSSERLSIGEKRNRLIDRARGDVIVHFDDDDYYARNYVTTMIGFLQAQEADLVNLRGWHLFDLRARFFGYWDLTRTTGAHYRCDTSGVALCRLAPAEADQLADLHLGYGFTYAYRRSVWRTTPFPDANWNEDGEFSRAAARHARLDGFQDQAGLCLHLLHPASTSCCFPQHHLPAVSLPRLFPGYAPPSTE